MNNIIKRIYNTFTLGKPYHYSTLSGIHINPIPIKFEYLSDHRPHKVMDNYDYDLEFHYDYIYLSTSKDKQIKISYSLHTKPSRRIRLSCWCGSRIQSNNRYIQWEADMRFKWDPALPAAKDDFHRAERIASPENYYLWVCIYIV